MNTRYFAVGATLAVGLSACSGSGSSPGSVTTVNPLQSKLQLAVGTANVFGASTGLNVVVTLRQPQGAQNVGASAALVNTPTLTGPFTLAGTAGTPETVFGSSIQTGPTSAELGGHAITATPQQQPGTTNIPPSSFGVSGGAFGLGLEPFNQTVTGTSANGVGTPATYVPYSVPLYDGTAADANAFVPWGGPPAFDPNQDGKGTRDNKGYPPGVLGVSEGLDVFNNFAPVVGAYTLAVSIPTSQSSNGALTTTANLTSATALPNVVAQVPTLDGNGGGTFPITLPAGVTEAYVQITDFGPPQPTAGSIVGCNGAAAKPVYYTLEVKASGSPVLPATDGPGNPGTTTPSICTAAQNTAANGSAAPGDRFTIQVIGFDYPAYEASYPNSAGNPAPVLVGATGQTDITISPVLTVSQPVGGGITTMSRGR